MFFRKASPERSRRDAKAQSIAPLYARCALLGKSENLNGFRQLQNNQRGYAATSSSDLAKTGEPQGKEKIFLTLRLGAFARDILMSGDAVLATTLRRGIG